MGSSAARKAKRAAGLGAQFALFKGSRHVTRAFLGEWRLRKEELPAERSAQPSCPAQGVTAQEPGEDAKRAEALLEGNLKSSEEAQRCFLCHIYEVPCTCDDNLPFSAASDFDVLGRMSPSELRQRFNAREVEEALRAFGM